MLNRDPPDDTPASNETLPGLWRLSRSTLLKSGLAAGALTALAPGELARAMLGDPHAVNHRWRGHRPTELRTYLREGRIDPDKADLPIAQSNQTIGCLRDEGLHLLPHD